MAVRKRSSGEKNQQLELARAVQRSLLPKPFEPTPRFELGTGFAPAQVVAGDFYDYFELQPDVVGFYLGDVQGKGLEGAMYAALVSGIMRGLQKSGTRPAQLLYVLNRRLCLRPIPDKFCVLSYAVLDLAHRTLSYSNAGLPFPLLVRHGRATAIELPGFPLGMFERATYNEREIELEPGDAVLFYTDGLTDSYEDRRNRDGEVVLRGLLERDPVGSARELTDRLLTHLLVPTAAGRQRRLVDDTTFLLLRIGWPAQ